MRKWLGERARERVKPAQPEPMIRTWWRESSGLDRDMILVAVLDACN